MSGSFENPDNPNDFIEPSEQSLVIPERHQAVFLKGENEQCYFGKLWVYPNLYVISDVYYFRPDMSELVWLQDSAHEPENVMHLPRENVKFWENLREDGRVQLAIEQHKEGLN